MDLQEITRYATRIEKLHKDGNYEDISSLLTDLCNTTVVLSQLQNTAIVQTLCQLVKSCPVAAVRKTAKDLLSKWKQVCSSPYEHKNIKHRSKIKECEPDDKDKTEISQSVPISTQHPHTGNILEPDNVNQELTSQASGFSVASGQLSPEGTKSLKEAGEFMNTHKAEVNQAVASDLPSYNGEEDSGATSTITPQPATESTNLRAKCVELLLRALTPDQEADVEATTQLSTLAHTIEKHIHALHSQNQLKYKSCVRSKLANLKNPKSPHLRQGLLTGALPPEVFARMSSKEMAGEELQQLREGYTAAGISEHQLPCGPGGMRTTKVRCRRCEAMDCTVTQVCRGTLFLPSWVKNSNTDEEVVTFVTCAGCGEQWYHSRWVCL
ncbi:transcription elongation factor A N-terminal and central domain-containing protein [Electrophorus electricus]|uniref:transcription elongation factor A N-terminal and central domain-containing protein n=1 Tax=Electrophorus electricus TaxID=8005 RepID=UPI0015D0358F|nr:transcription elongation factor A N-terminal and central domain-containing protein [Electrophorus electricus]